MDLMIRWGPNCMTGQRAPQGERCVLRVGETAGGVKNDVSRCDNDWVRGV